jgi:RES domain-containing protein
MAEHQSLAMIEYFAHIGADDPPKDLVLVTAAIPDSVSRRSISLGELPVNWRATPPPPQLAAIGDTFASDRRAAVLVVPSALAAEESNWLINPQHREVSRIRVVKTEPFRYDARFFR